MSHLQNLTRIKIVHQALGELADDHSVKNYLISELGALLKNKYLDEWIGCHLEYAEQRRIGFIISSMHELVRISKNN